MPRYNYKCSKCNEIIELWVPMEARDDKRTCNCGGIFSRTWEGVNINLPNMKNGSSK